MPGRLEGSQPINSIYYLKQIGSLPHKDVLGKYIRERLGVPLNSKITKIDLENYGKTFIDVTLLNERIYYLDFSV